MLLSMAQSVSAMAQFCAPNEHTNVAQSALVFDGSTDQLPSDSGQNGPLLSELNPDPAHDDDCVDCSNCQCCSHLALARLNIEPALQLPDTPVISFALVKVSNGHSPLLRPPKV